MGETTGISWTDSTINVWHGCEKVSHGGDESEWPEDLRGCRAFPSAEVTHG